MGISFQAIALVIPALHLVGYAVTSFASRDLRANLATGQSFMRLADIATRLLGLSEVLHTWLELLTGLDASRRLRIADYADEIAATMARTAEAMARLEKDPGDAGAARASTRELGRITGYVEDIVALLEDRLDGRKLAGVRRRLSSFAGFELTPLVAHKGSDRRIDRLMEAEGYFRALADGLRV